VSAESPPPPIGGSPHRIDLPTAFGPS
jgi:hypothetical protein